MLFVKNAYAAVKTQLSNRLVLILLITIVFAIAYIVILHNRLKDPVATEEYMSLTKVLDNEQEARKKDQDILIRMLAQSDKMISIQEKKDSIILNLIADDKATIQKITKQRDETINRVRVFNSNDISQYMSDNFGE